jgi:multidrug resistance efflux pump
MSKVFKGEVKARIVDTRFALSGKIAGVSKYTGDTVKKWNLIASLDRKILQMELDRQLADYEKVRADFDGFAKKYPDPQDDNKYTKAEKQAALNASVKDVELAKANLDQCDLFSPVDGTVLDDSGIIPGLYVTPAGGSVRIVDTSSYYFEIEAEQKDIPYFSEPKKCKVEITGLKEKITAESKPAFSDGKKFLVQIPITDSKEILLGLNGKANF